jgi:hypothetical protein
MAQQIAATVANMKQATKQLNTASKQLKNVKLNTQPRVNQRRRMGPRNDYLLEAPHDPRFRPAGARFVPTPSMFRAQSAAGKAWEEAALHPAVESDVMQPVGIPDHTSGPVVTFRAIDRWNIAAPKSAQNTWSCAIYTPPMGDVPAFAFVFADQEANVQLNSWKSQLVAGGNGFVQYNPTAGDPSTTGSALGFGSFPTIGNGIAYSHSSISTYSSPGGSTNAVSQQASNYRVMAKSTTAQLVCNSLSNQGLVIGGQVSNGIRDTHVTNYASGTAGTLTQSSVLEMAYPPGNAATLQQMDPKSSEWAAYYGAYIPIRAQEPNYQVNNVEEHYLWISPDGNSDADAVATGMECMYADTHNIGVTIFNNISVTATINLKAVTHFECRARAKSSWSMFQHPSPVLDQQAIDFVSTLSQRMPHVFPADDNSLGSILGKIAKFLIPSGKALVKEVTGGVIPGSWVDTGFDWLGGLFK